MAYLCKDEQTRLKIKNYINEYVRKNNASPSIRSIAYGTGISRAMVQRYMAAMRAEGELEYQRSDVTTDFTKKIHRDLVMIGNVGRVSCGVPKEPCLDATEYFSIPKAWVGEGTFYILEADGDSMNGVGIDDGDLIIVRQQVDFNDGDYVVALVDGCETLLKTAYHDIDCIRLHAENPRYADRFATDVRIQGVAIKVIKNLK